MISWGKRETTKDETEMRMDCGVGFHGGGFGGAGAEIGAQTICR